MSSENTGSARSSGVAGFRRRIDEINDINPQDVSLISQGTCVRATIPSQARHDNDIGLTNPGVCPSYYFENERLLIFDLNGYKDPEEEED